MITTAVHMGTAYDMYTISCSTADFTTAAHLAVLEAGLKAFGGVQMIGTPTNTNHDVRIAVAAGMGLDKATANQAACATKLAAAIEAVDTAGTLAAVNALGTTTVTAFAF
jgi:hypothetical protein